MGRGDAIANSGITGVQQSRRDFLKGGLGAAALLASVQAAQASSAGRDDVQHLLARISYGVRSQDLARAYSIGLEAYLDEQLTRSRPESEALADYALLELDRETLYGLEDGKGRCYRALVTGAVARMVHSEHQLHARMTEFWSDHFNVPLNYDITPDIVQFQRELRQHALGTFRDLLFASARAPAMLYYLDNASSTAEHPNENYARELLELHTLGVDGPYTEEDVKAAARAFTGWTIHKRTDSGFHFNSQHHDQGAKEILGRSFPAERGVEDGLLVLNILADHAATAEFICFKLCRRFVSDVPPQSLVDRLVDTWLETDGEIKPVLRNLFLSDEFRASKGQKLRRPLEFYAASLRVTGTEILKFWPQEEMLQDLAQLPHSWKPPDGYPDIANAWFTTNGLLARWNVAMRLTHAALSDKESSWDMLSRLLERAPEAATVGELVAKVSEQVFGFALSESELRPFIHYTADGAGTNEPVTPFLRARKLASLYGLMLASPQFQWT